MSMEESHRHGRTPCAYRGVNRVIFRFSSAQCFCIRFSVKLSDLVSSPIDSFFPSFRIHSIVIANCLKLSQILNNAALQLWRDTTKVTVLLTQNYRATDPTVFSVFDRIRCGICTSAGSPLSRFWEKWDIPGSDHLLERLELGRSQFCLGAVN